MTRNISPSPTFSAALGSLMFASTLFFSSNSLLLVVLLLLTISGGGSRMRWHIWLPAAFSGVALLNLLLHLNDFDMARHASAPSVVLVCIVAVLAPRIPAQAWKAFVFLVCIEVLIGLYEYQTGTVAVLDSQAALANQDLSLESTLLYDLRVFGLSANSSLLAEKVFISIIMTWSIPGLFKTKWLPLGVLAIGLFVSFNRTAIASVLLFAALHASSVILTWRRLLLAAVVLTVVVGVMTANLDDILLQFTRGSGDELSHSELSRLYFWQKAIELVLDHPIAGNGSLTFRVEDPVTGLPQHTHNSFMMVLATHGLIAAACLLSYVAVRMTGRNWRAVACFLAFSLTQYFVFWNLSVPDIALFWILGHAALGAASPPIRPHQVGRIRATASAGTPIPQP